MKTASPKFNDDARYLAWIKQNIGDIRWETCGPNGSLRHMAGSTGRATNGEPLCQRCDEAAPLMAKAFPELRAIRGTFKQDGGLDPFYHCWCVDSKGGIVDPTGIQFDYMKPGAHRLGSYEPYCRQGV